MGRVTVDDRDAFLNEPMGEADLLIWDMVAPVAAPMTGSYVFLPPPIYMYRKEYTAEIFMPT
jgi:hypothetical protein